MLCGVLVKAEFLVSRSRLLPSALLAVCVPDFRGWDGSLSGVLARTTCTPQSGWFIGCWPLGRRESAPPPLVNCMENG